MFLFLLFSVLLLCTFFRLKELFQVKNRLTTSLLFFSENAKIWVGRTTLKGEKKRMAYDRISINHDVINVNVSQINDTPLNFLLGQSSQANDVVYQNRLIRSLLH